MGCAIARTRKTALSARLRRRGDVPRKLHVRYCGLLLSPERKKRSRRRALFASSVSLTSPLRSEVPEKTKVATSISRSIPFHPVLIKPYVTGWNADASKSGRILRFFRRSPGREKPPRPSDRFLLSYACCRCLVGVESWSWRVELFILTFTSSLSFFNAEWQSGR